MFIESLFCIEPALKYISLTFIVLMRWALFFALIFSECLEAIRYIHAVFYVLSFQEVLFDISLSSKLQTLNV